MVHVHVGVEVCPWVGSCVIGHNVILTVLMHGMLGLGLGSMTWGPRVGRGLPTCLGRLGLWVVARGQEGRVGPTGLGLIF